MTDNSFREVFKKKDFLKIWGSQILSQVTLYTLNFIIIIKVFEKTHSTMAISLVWIFYAMPAILLGPISGALVDIFSRKKTLFWTNFLNAIVVLFYLLVGKKIYPMYAIIFLYSTINQLYIPAESATLPSIVPKKLLPAANTIFLFTIYASFLLGFGLSGPFIKLVGNRFPFVAASFFLLMGAALVSFLPKDGKAKKISWHLLTIIRKLKEGYRFIKEHSMVQAPLAILISAQMVISLFIVIFPSYAVDVLGIDLRDAGPFLIIPLGLGAVMSALVVNRLVSRWRKRKIISYAALLASLSLFALAIVVGFLKEVTWTVAVFTFLLGSGAVGILIPTQTFLQEQTPALFRARVFGALGFLITLASLPPVLFAGAISDLLGVSYILLLVAISTFVFGYLMTRRDNALL